MATICKCGHEYKGEPNQGSIRTHEGSKRHKEALLQGEIAAKPGRRASKPPREPRETIETQLATVLATVEIPAAIVDDALEHLAEQAPATELSVSVIPASIAPTLVPASSAEPEGRVLGKVQPKRPDVEAFLRHRNVGYCEASVKLPRGGRMLVEVNTRDEIDALVAIGRVHLQPVTGRSVWIG